jgi:hypothetical protein
MKKISMKAEIKIRLTGVKKRPIWLVIKANGIEHSFHCNAIGEVLAIIIMTLKTYMYGLIETLVDREETSENSSEDLPPS